MYKIILVFSLILINFSSCVKKTPPANWNNMNQEVSIFNNYSTISATKEASEIGKNIIEKGGNAIDALVAMQAAISLTEMHASGFGGDGFILYYDKKANKLYSFNGRSTKPKNATTKQTFNSQNLNQTTYREEFDINYIAIPGTLKLFDNVHKKFGKLKWKDLIQPTIDLAENGFEINPRLKYFYEKYSPTVKNIENAITFDEKTKLYKNEEYANTLKLISNQNFVKDFYQDNFAKEMTNHLKENGSVIEFEDFKNYKTFEQNSTCINYKEYKICTRDKHFSPLIALKLLEKYDFKKLENDENFEAKKIQVISNALNIALANRAKFDEFNSKQKDVNKILKTFENVNYNLEEKSQIFNAISLENRMPNSDKNINKNGTTTFSAIDKEGNVAIAVTTVNGYFGSSFNYKGIYFNNTMLDYSNEENSVNSIEKNERPRSSMSPIIVFDEKGKPVFGVSSAGGIRILTYVTSTLIDMLEFDKNPQDAINSIKYATYNNLTLEVEPNRMSCKDRKYLKQNNFKVVETEEIISGLNAFKLNYNKDGTLKNIENGFEVRRSGFASGK